MARAKKQAKLDLSIEPPRIGALSNLFRGDPQEVADLFAEYELESVQILPNFPGLRMAKAADVTRRRCQAMSQPFQSHGLWIAAVSAHTNFLDPDSARRRRSIQRFDALIEHCGDFGAQYVITDSGSLNADQPWAKCPENHAGEAFELFRKRLMPSLRLAERANVVILLEAHLRQVIYSVDRARETREALGPHVAFVMDPVNLFTRSMCHAPARSLRAVFEAIGDACPVGHAKDVRYSGGELITPRAGAGVLDYREYLELLGRYQPGIPLILEQLRPEELRETVDFIDRFFETAPS